MFIILILYIWMMSVIPNTIFDDSSISDSESCETQKLPPEVF